jgi:hypothetical protein
MKTSFFAIVTYMNKRGVMKSHLLLDDVGSPLRFETTDFSYENIQKIVDDAAPDRIKGYPERTSLYNLCTDVVWDDMNKEWLSAGSRISYSMITKRFEVRT